MHIRTAAMILAASAFAANAQIYSSSFEGTDGGWVEGGGGEWERGVPVFSPGAPDGAGGPMSAFDGSEVWATNLDGDYANLGASSTLSQTFDLSGVSTASLEWYQWVEVFWSFDTAKVFVNGAMVYERATSAATPDWEFQSVDLTPYAGQSAVTVEFNLFATTVVSRSGWYIDAVTITPAPSAAALLGLGGLVAVRRRR